MSDKKKYHFFYRNGLSLAAIGLFLLFLFGQAYTGWHEYNSEVRDLGGQAVSFAAYFRTGHFLEVTCENWESEFLQMFLYVLFTVWFRQLGSSESKSLDKKEEVDREPMPTPDAPWPVKKGGFILTVYKNSLSLAFLILFLISFGLHAYGSYEDYSLQEHLKGHTAKDFLEFMGETRFWFESFQNWQSEFLSIASIVLLSIYLRQFGSPESKPVDASHNDTGK